MTDVKFGTNPAKGHGLGRITDGLYAQFTKGARTPLIPCLVLLEVDGTNIHKTNDGLQQSIRVQVVKVEPFTDQDDKDQAIWRLQKMFEQRTTSGEQTRIIMPDDAVEEQAKAELEAIDLISAELGLTGGELEANWREYWAIGPDEERAFGNEGARRDYHKAAYQHLLEFRLHLVEVLDDKQGEKPPAVISDPAEDGSAELDETESDEESHRAHLDGTAKAPDLDKVAESAKTSKAAKATAPNPAFSAAKETKPAGLKAVKDK